MPIKVHKTRSLTYYEPSWIESPDIFYHRMLPQPMAVTLVLFKDCRDRLEDDLRVSIQFPIAPQFLHNFDNEVLIAVGKGWSYAVDPTRVEKLLQDGCPDLLKADFQNVYFDKRKNCGWLIWGRKNCYGCETSVKIKDEVPKKYQDCVYTEGDESFMVEDDYLAMCLEEIPRQHLAEGELLQEVPYVKQIMTSFRNGLLLPHNWLRFNYAMAIRLAWWQDQLRCHISDAWKCLIHGTVRNI